MVHINIESYLERLHQAKKSADVWSTFLETATKLGVLCVSYGFRKLPNTALRKHDFLDQATVNVDSKDHTWITTMPQSCIDYWYNRVCTLEKINPMLNHIQKSMTPLFLGNDFLKPSEDFYEDRKGFYTLAESHGLYAAYGIPIKRHSIANGGEVVYHTPYSKDEFIDFIQRNGPTLHMLALYMHLQFQPLEREERAKAMDIKGRPLQILHQMQEGLTNAEIAHNLGVSAPTVSYHIKELKERLDAATTREIIPLALRLNIINDC